MTSIVDADDAGHVLAVELQRPDEVLQLATVGVDGREDGARAVERARDRVALRRLLTEVVVEVQADDLVVGEAVAARDDAAAGLEAQVAVEHPDRRRDGLQHRVHLGLRRDRFIADKCH